MAYVYLFYISDSEKHILKEIEDYLQHKKGVKIIKKNTMSDVSELIHHSKLIDGGRLKVGNQSIKLTKTELLILNLLEKHEGQVLEYDFIYEMVWDEAPLDQAKIAVQRHIVNIHRKLKRIRTDNSFTIINIRGLGYVLKVMPQQK